MALNNMALRMWLGTTSRFGLNPTGQTGELISRHILGASRLLTTAAAVLATTGWLAPVVNAQQVFRIVGPDGKVSFSDQPPPAASNAKTTTAAGSSGTTSGAASGALPYELRQIASKYPVTLYTSQSCGPCASARTLLTGRGVPFTEKTITSPEDIKALQRLSGDASLPFATIGGQQLNGFSDVEWTQFLNAAGYPATSVLPASYRQVAATPLVAAAAVPSAASAGATTTLPARPPAPAAVPPQATSANNPAGIKF
jgi:glutaredoxin